MGLFKGFHDRANEKFERELGAAPEVAALASLALHPFVGGSPAPKRRELTKLVRAGSSKFARDVRSVKTADELLVLARATVQPWHWAARHFGEEHYSVLFREALAAAPHDGKVGTIFGRDPYEMERLRNLIR